MLGTLHGAVDHKIDALLGFHLLKKGLYHLWKALFVHSKLPPEPVGSLVFGISIGDFNGLVVRNLLCIMSMQMKTSAVEMKDMVP